MGSEHVNDMPKESNNEFDIFIDAIKSTNK